MKLDRRRLLGLGLGGTAAAALTGFTAGCAGDNLHQTARLLASRASLPQPFTRPLTMPPVKKPISTRGGIARYEVVQRAAEVEILPGLETPIMAYDGIFPGPTFETRRGQTLIVNQRNTLHVPTVTHLHGGHTPAESDGYPIDLVLPEGAAHGGHGTGHDHGGDVSHGHRDYTYPNDQPAATLWYHDHRMDFTAPQVWHGLAGFHLVRDEIEDALPLPSGSRELPLMIMDRAFEEDGTLRYPALDPTMMGTPGVEDAYMSGVMGDVILVNGTPWPVLEVEAARYRLRLLNASNARRYDLALEPAPPGGKAFVQIGSDGGLLAAPVHHDTITMASAERFDVIVDFSRYTVGTEVIMKNTLGHDGTAQVMKFVVARKGKDESTIPDTLAEVEPLMPSAGARVREWRFTRSTKGAVHGKDGWVINGRVFDPHRMDASVRLGEVEIWRFFTDLHHPIHVHLDPFQVLSRGGRNPGPMDAGWKDTIDLRPAEYAEVAIRFTDHAGPYVLHCHNLEHEDMMMMAAFETVS